MSSGGEPPEFGGLTVTTTPDQQRFDLFDPPGHRIWVEVSDEQLGFINAQQTGGNPWGDPYTPSPSVTFADHVLVEEAENLSVADYGKLAVTLGGGASFRQWSEESIPNLAINVSRFEDGLTLGGFERFELHNALVGGIFREAVAQRVLGALGVPSLRTSFAFLGSSVWGEGVWVPMVVTQPFDPRYCSDQAAEIGGECANVWYTQGQAGDVPDAPECMLDTCDENRLVELAEALDETEEGPGFGAALADLIDWPRFYAYQCASFIVDANRFGVVVIERDDGRLVWSPHSLDLSSGHAPSSGFLRTDRVSRGCQADPECWEASLAACGAMAEAFDAMNPHTVVESARDTVESLGMARNGDAERAEELREWYRSRQAQAAAEVELYSGPMGPDGCPEVLERCVDDTCGTAEECMARQCQRPFVWCEARRMCVYEYDFCPKCEGAAPFFCGANDACEASVEDCAALCYEPYPYCEASNRCDSWCPGDTGGTGGMGATGGVVGVGAGPAVGGAGGIAGTGGSGGTGMGASAGAPSEGGIGAGGNAG
jgi:hypothetical protein